MSRSRIVRALSLTAVVLGCIVAAVIIVPIFTVAGIAALAVYALVRAARAFALASD